MRRPSKQVLFVCMGLAATALFVWPFCIDDAYITARYAKHIFEGAGYSFNDGGRSDGVTGPLWLVPMLVSEAIAAPPLVLAKATSALCVVLASAWIVATVRMRALGSTAAWATALVCLTSMPLVVWAVAGLETGAACLIFVLMAKSASQWRGPHAGVSLGVAISCAAWLRPEMALLACAALFALWLRDKRAAVMAFSLAAVGAIALVAFRLTLFGDVLPLSAYAKPSELQHGVRYAWSAFLRTDVVCAAILTGYAALRGSTRDRALCLLVVAHVTACVLAGGDWMPGRRLFVPMVPTIALLVGVGFARLLMRRRVLAWALLSGVVCFGALECLHELPAARASGLDAPLKHAEIVAQLRSEPGPIAMLDVGAVGYALDETILDLGGLTCPAVAHLPGGHLDKRVEDAWLRTAAPRWIVLHAQMPPQVTRDGQLITLSGYPVERRVARLAYVRECCRVVRTLAFAPHYHYVFLRCTSSP